MQFEAAVIKEQGVTFVVIPVKQQAVISQQKVIETMESFFPYFPVNPIVLMHQDSRNIPTYYGRKDIIDFLVNHDPSTFPWYKFTY